MSEWRIVPGFPRYKVSDDGLVCLAVKARKHPKGHVLQPTDEAGYPQYNLWKDRRYHTLKVSRLVLMAFVGMPPTDKHQAAHNDGDPSNNHLSNLRWATPKENQADRWKHGTRQWGGAASRSHLTAEAVADIRERFDGGEKSIHQLAAIHGVTRRTISQIVFRKTWVDKAEAHAIQ